jgi:ATP-dependent metalloprotease FtsH
MPDGRGGEEMENKSDRRFNLEDYWRHHGVKPYSRKTVSKFLKEHKQFILTCVLLFILLVALVGIFSQLQGPNIDNPPLGVTVVDYNTFVEQVRAGNILKVTIQGNEITGTLADSLHGQPCTDSSGINANDPLARDPSQPADSICTIYTHLPARNDSAFLPLLLSHGVVITTLPVKQSSTWLRLFLAFIPVLLVLLIFFNLPPWRKDRFSLDTVDKSISQFLKGRVRRFERTPEKSKPRPAEPPDGPGTPIIKQRPAASLKCPKSSVTFADVAGIDEVRAELEEVVQFLRSPERFNRLGAHIPRGILLIGPPGTGKTLIAKAVAGEACVPFFHMNASEFVEMFVGVGASRVRDLFQRARQSAPCVIFIDEVDAVGRKRSIRLTENGERDQTLNQLLVELDGFNSRSSIIVLAATNRADMLDAALLRPGRFDRQVNVPLPDRLGREAILRVHTRHSPLHKNVRLDYLARLTTGMSGADLANLVNEAALCAARRDLNSLTQECFEDALARIQLGAQRPLVMSETDKRIIAFHESGHALVAYYLPEADTVNSITILPRGQHLGVTQFIAQEDRYNLSRESLIARIAVGLGGRVAEELTFGPNGVTTEAENDLQSVTALAWRMVTHWGMGKQVGTVFADYCGASSADHNSHQSDAVSIQSGSSESKSDDHLQLVRKKVAAYQQTYPMKTSATRYISSPAMAALIDSEVQRILNEGRVTACTLLTEHYTQLTRLAQALIEHEQLDRKQFEAVMQNCVLEDIK